MSSQATCAAAEALGITCDRGVEVLPIDSFKDKRGTKLVQSTLFGETGTRTFSICKRHYDALKNRPKYFCDGLHPKKINCRLHEITLQEYVHASRLSDASPGLKLFVLEPNRELCRPCYKTYLERFAAQQLPAPSESTTDTQSGSTESVYSPEKRSRPNISLEQAKKEFNDLLEALKLPPIPDAFKKMNSKRQKNVLLEKLDQIWTVASKRAADISPELAQEGFSVNEARTAVKERKEITAKMKSHIANDNIRIELKIQLASLCPKDWSERYIATELGVSRYIATQGRKLKTFGDNLPRERMTKSEALKGKIVEFWRRSDISRELPGKKDYRRVRKATGGWEKIQKRLLYVTYLEAYQAFTGTGGTRERDLGEIISEHNDEELQQLLLEEKLSISTFVKYKPKEVVPISRRRQHNVCVCRYHENTRLASERIGLRDMKLLMSLLVCPSDREFKKDCMYLRCPECRNNSAQLEEYIYKYLNSKNMLERDFTIQQWERTDATGFVTVSVHGADYPHFLTQKLKDLLKHHYVTKKQNSFFQQAKDELDDNTAVVVVDFSENFVPIYQNEIPAMHFGANRTKGQATLHPIAMHIRRGEVSECKSFCIFTDYMDHTQNAVHTFISVFLKWVNQEHPQLTKFKFFSDGCAGQYKSVKAFKNIALFSKDHPGLSVSWSYFATSHGKNVCDGIGGYIKRCASDDVLRESVVIRDGKELYNHILKKIPTLKCFYLSKGDVQAHIDDQKLNERYEKLESVHGTLGIHHVVPWDDNYGVDLFEVGSDSLPFTRHRFDTEPLRVTDDFLGKSVACVYQDDWYIGEVHGIDPEEEEAYIKFFKKPNISGKMQRGTKGDECCVPFGRILALVDVIQEKTGRSWKLRGDTSKILADLDMKLTEFLRRK